MIYHKYTYHTLGFVAQFKRNIKPGTQYEKYFASPTKTDPIVIADGRVEHTVRYIAKIVKDTLHQTAAISKVLQGKSLKDTCKNIWEFCYNHFQYTEDKFGIEQLRTPVRSWADRAKGIDCDCFTILQSSILANLGINHSLRITAYDGNSYYQHIYVVVPATNGIIYILDPVLDQFNLEKTYSAKKDFTMAQLGIPIQVLNGLGNVHENTFNPEQDFARYFQNLKGFEESHSMPEESKVRAIYNILYDMLEMTTRYPQLLDKAYQAKEMRAWLIYVLKNWNDRAFRSTAIRKAAMWELSANKKTGTNDFQLFINLANYMYGDGLGNPQRIINTLIRILPIAAIGRGAIELIIKTNMFRIRSRVRNSQLQIPQGLENYIRDWGLDVDPWEAMAANVKSYETIRKIFVDTLKGKEDNLKNWIRNPEKNYLEKTERDFARIMQLGRIASIQYRVWWHRIERNDQRRILSLLDRKNFTKKSYDDFIQLMDIGVTINILTGRKAMADEILQRTIGYLRISDITERRKLIEWYSWHVLYEEWDSKYKPNNQIVIRRGSPAITPGYYQIAKTGSNLNPQLKVDVNKNDPAVVAWTNYTSPLLDQFRNDWYNLSLRHKINNIIDNPITVQTGVVNTTRGLGSDSIGEPVSASVIVSAARSIATLLDTILKLFGAKENLFLNVIASCADKFQVNSSGLSDEEQAEATVAIANPQDESIKAALAAIAVGDTATLAKLENQYQNKTDEKSKKNLKVLKFLSNNKDLVNCTSLELLKAREGDLDLANQIARNPGDSSDRDKGKLAQFISDNPIPVAIGTAAVATIGYLGYKEFAKPKAKAMTNNQLKGLGCGCESLGKPIKLKTTLKKSKIKTVTI